MIVVDAALRHIYVEITHILKESLYLLRFLVHGAQAFGKAHKSHEILKISHMKMKNYGSLLRIDAGIFYIPLGHGLPVDALQRGGVNYIPPFGNVVQDKVVGFGNGGKIALLVGNIADAPVVGAVGILAEIKEQAGADFGGGGHMGIAGDFAEGIGGNPFGAFSPH